MGTARADAGTAVPATRWGPQVPPGSASATRDHPIAPVTSLSGESHRQEAAIQQLRVKATFQVNLKFHVLWMGFLETSQLPRNELLHRARQNLPQPWGQRGQHSLLPFTTQQNLPILSFEQDCILLSENQNKKETVYGEGISVRN